MATAPTCMSFTSSTLPAPTNSSWNFTYLTTDPNNQFGPLVPTTEACLDGYNDLQAWLGQSNTSNWFYEDGKMNSYLVQCVCGNPGCSFNCGSTPSCTSATNPACSYTPPPPPPPDTLPPDLTPTEPVSGAYIMGNSAPTCTDVGNWLNGMILEYGSIALANADESSFLQNYNVYLTQCAGQPANTTLPGYYSTQEQQLLANGGVLEQFTSPATLASYYNLGKPQWTFSAADQGSSKDIACANAFMALQRGTQPADVQGWVQTAGNNERSWQILEEGQDADSNVAQLANLYISNGCGTYTPPPPNVSVGIIDFIANHPIWTAIGGTIGFVLGAIFDGVVGIRGTPAFLIIVGGVVSGVITAFVVDNAWNESGIGGTDVSECQANGDHWWSKIYWFPPARLGCTYVQCYKSNGLSLWLPLCAGGSFLRSLF